MLSRASGEKLGGLLQQKSSQGIPMHSMTVPFKDKLLRAFEEEDGLQKMSGMPKQNTKKNCIIRRGS